MNHESRLRFPNERELVIETLSRLMETALTKVHKVQAYVLSVTINRTNDLKQIRISTSYYLSNNGRNEEGSCGQRYTDSRTVKAGEVFLNGQMLTSVYFAALARVAEEPNLN